MNMKKSKKILFRFLWMGALVFVFGLCYSCTKKVISSEGTPSSISQERIATPKAQSEVKPEQKTESTPSEKPIVIPEEKKIQEESLPKEALAEKTIREEAAKKESNAQSEIKKRTLETVYFDYDQWLIREDQKDIMTQNAQWLKANPQVRIRLEGNCDERGTAEYNLALGQKRADAAKTFLQGLGILENRMQTISYGLERPTDPGHNEAAWAKNRRVDFVPIR
jgi:peptidoglycan-associated lipoprotein